MPDRQPEHRAWVIPVVLATVALALRLPGLGGGLWNDEISAIVQSFRTAFPENLSEFRGDNKHPLYALLAHACIAVFGESPWSIRLPAMAFGVAAVPMLYRLARPLVGTREAVTSALLLAVSYHHVWFSQSARGYSALLFFALWTTHLLFRALRTPDWRTAAGFAVAIAAGTYTHLTFVFFVFAQFLLALIMWAWPRHGMSRPDGRLVLLPFVGGGLISLAAHAPMLGAMLDYFLAPSDQGGVSSPAWALAEGVRVLRAGLGDYLGLAVLGLVLGGAAGLSGLWTWFRRDRDLTLLVVLAVLCIIAGAAAGRGTMYPRFFFMLGGFFVLFVVRGAFATGTWLVGWLGGGAEVVARRGERVGMAAVGVLLLGSLASLPRNYRVPKQDFDGPIAAVRAAEQPGDRIAVADVTARVYLEYYALQATSVRTAQELDALRQGSRVWFIYSFPRYLALYDAGLAAFVARECASPREFPSTLGGGEVLLCRLDPPGT